MNSNGVSMVHHGARVFDAEFNTSQIEFAVDFDKTKEVHLIRSLPLKAATTPSPAPIFNT
jgi:hypothetical protein